MIITFKVSVGTLLQANGQVGDSQVGRGARQTTVLSGSGASLARLVARPANAAFIRETSGWTAADASAEKQISRCVKRECIFFVVCGK